MNGNNGFPTDRETVLVIHIYKLICIGKLSHMTKAPRSEQIWKAAIMLSGLNPNMLNQKMWACQATSDKSWEFSTLCKWEAIFIISSAGKTERKSLRTMSLFYMTWLEPHTWIIKWCMEKKLPTVSVTLIHTLRYSSSVVILWCTLSTAAVHFTISPALHCLLGPRKLIICQIRMTFLEFVTVWVSLICSLIDRWSSKWFNQLNTAVVI